MNKAELTRYIVKEIKREHLQWNKSDTIDSTFEAYSTIVRFVDKYNLEVKVSYETRETTDNRVEIQIKNGDEFLITIWDLEQPNITKTWSLAKSNIAGNKQFIITPDLTDKSVILTDIKNWQLHNLVKNKLMVRNIALAAHMSNSKGLGIN